MKNLLIGKMYIDNVGDMNFRNHSTKDEGVLTLIERGSKV